MSSVKLHIRIYLGPRFTLDVDSSTVVSDLKASILDADEVAIGIAESPGAEKAVQVLNSGANMLLLATNPANRILSSDSKAIREYGLAQGEVVVHVLPKERPAKEALANSGDLTAQLQALHVHSADVKTQPSPGVPQPAANDTASSAPSTAPGLPPAGQQSTSAGLPAPGVVPTSAEMTAMLRRMQADPQFANEVMERAAKDHGFAQVCLREMSANPEYMGLAMQLMQTNPQVLAQAQSLMMQDPMGRAAFGAAQAQGGGAAPTGGDTRPPAVRYAESLEQLAAMGFTDEAASLKALESAAGDVNRAIEILVGSS
eukprot:gnl/TRDRNA2_/TRDRNA2_33507_c0_seq1.p1 gnl/TRDRNA2_/TRDRNA2_33507_c0~~gnl/TRDRNA2_/TRDRNA2_33507_c0_seq1.p1  ORF type:complete len:315 (+),score=55.25 gnl/TRDRNA2_/TRDRNA2_33507_c0_seq1:82-1026(+)